MTRPPPTKADVEELIEHSLKCETANRRVRGLGRADCPRCMFDTLIAHLEAPPEAPGDDRDERVERLRAYARGYFSIGSLAHAKEILRELSDAFDAERTLRKAAEAGWDKASRSLANAAEAHDALAARLAESEASTMSDGSE